MANKTRLRKVMRTITALAKNTPDDANWNQNAWNDGDSYVIGDGRERYLIDEVWDPAEREYRGEMQLQGNEPVKCNTSGCFAGWAVALYAPKGTQVRSDRVYPPGREARSMHSYAQELLDLDEEQADELFDGDNSLGDLKEKVRELTG